MTLRGETLKYNYENARIITHAIKEAGINFVSYVPDSWFRQVNRLLAKDSNIPHILATREDEAMAIAAGAYLGGKRPAVIMEGSGWGFSGLMIARISYLHHIPWLVISSHTGGPGEISYYHSEHRFLVMPMLNALNIPYTILTNISDAGWVFKESQWAVEMQKVPVAVIVPGHILWEGY